MNFCDESDIYISLYIDEQLDYNDREEFMKHVEKCPQCAQKLKEESYIANLCKNQEPIELPKDFSQSLHSRLIEVSQKDKNNKRLLFINKKVMTAISAAAVVAISLLAYKFIPDMGSMMDKTAYTESTAAQADTAVTDNMKNNKNGGIKAEPESGNAISAGGGNRSEAKSDSSNNVGLAGADKGATGGVQEESAASKQKNTSGKEYVIQNDATPQVKIKVTFSEALKSDGSNTRKAKGESNESPEVVINSDTNNKLNSDQTVAFSLAEQDKGASEKVLSNYVEMSLIVSSVENEMENLNALMNQVGATAEESGFVNDITENAEGIVAYIDYSVPLSEYSSLQSEALLKYKLELKTKTDIIKKDITEEYDNLQIQINDIETKISEALKNGQETAALEAEKTTLVEKTNKLLAKRDMITVRIFFVKR